MTDFHIFSKAVQEQFELMSKGELFTVDIDGDELYAAYQAAFPAGTNEVFRKQREHECSTCRNFIKNIGAVVSINDDLTLNTVWDVQATELPYPYSDVAFKMAILVNAMPIKGLFRAEEPTYGGKPNKDNETDIVWNHFYGKVDKKHYLGSKSTPSAASVIGDYNNKLGVFKRAMTEFNLDSINTVVDLIESNNLYKGEEFKANVVGLRKLFIDYNTLLLTAQQNAFLFKNLQERGSIIKNSSIGTLIEDLSAGVELERAVKSYEDKVSGTNYKRPTALITPRMVADAMKTIDDLGIEDSLHRRLATIEDVAVTDVLYVDNDVRGKMKGGVGNLLLDAATAPAVIKDNADIERISLDTFLANVLPKAKKVEVLVKNEHQGNFMVLTAPAYSGTTPIFKWDNQFAWSYDGNITDSIKERVKAAGGAVDGALRISLAWFNHDDLDLHVVEPSGAEIYFGNYRGRGALWNRQSLSPNGGMLDVDMNAGGGTTRTPVENVTFDRMTDGEYRVIVHNYSKRETRDPGFTLEVAVNGVPMHYSAKSSPSSGSKNHALNLTVKNGAITKVVTGAGIEGRAFSQEKWGVQTEQFTRVDSMMLSPNYWGDNAVGNKHLFMILEGCKTDVPARGIYNEFLQPEFDKHRKVFEVLGNKMMCEPTANQLAGVGFSSTRKDIVTVRVNGHKQYSVFF